MEMQCVVQLVILDLYLYTMTIQWVFILIQRCSIYQYQRLSQILATSVFDCINRAHAAQPAPIMITIPSNRIA